MKALCSSLMLHFHIDLLLFDGFHTPDVSPVIRTLFCKLFILLECFDFEIIFLEGSFSLYYSYLEGRVSHSFHVPYGLQGVHFDAFNPFPHLFMGCSYSYIKNPLACIFHTYLAVNLSDGENNSFSELCTYLGFYRSEYIRLRTDELSGIEDFEYLDQKHPLLVCRLFIYCFLHLVEITAMKIGIHDVDYLFQHLHQHYEQVLTKSSEVTKHILFLEFHFLFLNRTF